MGISTEEGIEPPKYKGRWERIREIIWDGEREPEERRLVQKLDLHLM